MTLECGGVTLNSRIWQNWNWFFFLPFFGVEVGGGAVWELEFKIFIRKREHFIKRNTQSREWLTRLRPPPVPHPVWCAPVQNHYSGFPLDLVVTFGFDGIGFDGIGQGQDAGPDKGDAIQAWMSRVSACDLDLTHSSIIAKPASTPLRFPQACTYWIPGPESNLLRLPLHITLPLADPCQCYMGLATLSCNYGNRADEDHQRDPAKTASIWPSGHWWNAGKRWLEELNWSTRFEDQAQCFKVWEKMSRQRDM